MGIFVNINYTGNYNYKSLNICYEKNEKRIKKNFKSGDFIKDWFELNKYIAFNDDFQESHHIRFSSEVDCFIMSSNYKPAFLFVENEIGVLKYNLPLDRAEKGIEFFVPENKEFTWDELKNYCKEI